MNTWMIPTTLTDYRAFLDDKVLLGVTETTLPGLSYLTTELAGAGVNGKLNYPTALTDNITMSINWRMFTREAAILATPGVHNVTLRGSMEEFDPTLGIRLEKSLRVITKIMPVSPSPGRMTAGEGMDSTNEFTVIYVKYELDGQTILEHDKFNYILRFMNAAGELMDAYQNLRANLGLT